MTKISDEYIEKCLTIFYRFLKERRKYCMVKKYLFYEGRTKEEFFSSVRRLYGAGYRFGNILHIIYTLGLEMDYAIRYGIDYYKKIEPISRAFTDYWYRNNFDKKIEV